MSPQSRIYRQLQLGDCVTLASLKQQDCSVSEITSVLDRSASTISRELCRNASTGHYGSATALHSCRYRRQQARILRKLHCYALLFGFVLYLQRSIGIHR